MVWMQKYKQRVLGGDTASYFNVTLAAAALGVQFYCILCVKAYLAVFLYSFCTYPI